MSNVKRTITIDLEPKPDDPTAQHVATLSVNGQYVTSAQGVDDVFALQNLLTKLQAIAVDDSIVDSVRTTFSAAIRVADARRP